VSFAGCWTRLAPHGFGSAALERVLRCVSDRAADQGLDTPDFVDPSSASVRAEEVRGHSRADIVIESPSWTVVIEAKINAAEQPRQGERLSDLWPGATYVFLTRHGEPMTTAGEGAWVSMRWGDLLGAIHEVTAECEDAEVGSPAAVRARRAVHDYLVGSRRLAR
jgi:hypothetical protein